MLKYIFLLYFVLVSFVWSVPGRTKKTNPANNNNNEKRQIYSLKIPDELMDSIGLSLSLSTMIHLSIFTTSPNVVRNIAISTLEHVQIGGEISPEDAKQLEIINGLIMKKRLFIRLPKLDPKSPILSNLNLLFQHYLYTEFAFAKFYKQFIIHPDNVLDIVKFSLDPGIQDISEELWSILEKKLLTKVGEDEQKVEDAISTTIRAKDQKLKRWLTQRKLSKQFKPYRFKDDCSEEGQNSFFSDRRSDFPFHHLFISYPWLVPYIEIEVCELTEKMYEEARKEFHKHKTELLQNYDQISEAEKAATDEYIVSGNLFFDVIKPRLINLAKRKI